MEDLSFIFGTMGSGKTTKVLLHKYGLRTNFKGELFAGSKRLFELTDNILALDSRCHCGIKTVINARYNENGIIYDGQEVVIGGDDDYISLCYQCWKDGNLVKRKVMK